MGRGRFSFCLSLFVLSLSLFWGACAGVHVPGWGGVPCQGCVRHSLFSGVRVLVSTFLAGVVSHARGACVTSHVPELSLSLSLCSLYGVRVLVSTSLAGVVSHARGACVTSHVPALSLSLSLFVLSMGVCAGVHVPGWGGVPCQGCVRH